MLETKPSIRIALELRRNANKTRPSFGLAIVAPQAPSSKGMGSAWLPVARSS